MWTAFALCTVCRKIDPNSIVRHRVAHDDRDPPPPGTLWMFRCPCTSRLVLIDVSKLEWEHTSGWIGSRVEIEPYRMMSLIEFDR